MPEQLSKQLEFDFILNQIKPEPKSDSFDDYIMDHYEEQNEQQGDQDNE
jgi:hypothetical protein